MFNFELEIYSQADGIYRSRVVEMPVPWAVDTPPENVFELNTADNNLQRLLATLSGERPSVLDEKRAAAREFGELLYQKAFSGDVGLAFVRSNELAVARNQQLRLRLVTDLAGKLAEIPWEFLHDGSDYLVLSRSTPLVRYPRQVAHRRHVDLSLPLRILVMIANPIDMSPLNVAEERQLLERATAALQQQRVLEIDFLEDATLQNLQRKLREKDYHIFHYVGHSDYDPATGVGWLALEDRFGEKSHESVTGEMLARELSEENTIRLVVLNSCHGARTSDQNPAGGIASSLVTRGIPAVVANQFEISNEAAAIFAEEFYTSITEGLRVDEAISEGRRAVAGALNNIEWATPVLYLRTTDGPLFDIVRARVNLRQRDLWMVIGGISFVMLFLLLWAFSSIFDGDEVPSAVPPPREVDLEITDMDLSTNRPAPGEVVFMEIDVINRGPDNSIETRLEFLADDQDGRTLQIVRLPSLTAGETDTVRIPFQFNWFGTFISRADIDPDATLNDPDRRNNVRSLPVITSSLEYFVVNFSDTLPDGQRITEPTPVSDNMFALWGFEIGVEPTTAECEDAVPWFKIRSDGIVVLGTGLPDDQNTCAAETLAITLLRQRDPTMNGTTGIRITLFPSEAVNRLTAFTDRERTRPFGYQTVTVDNQNPTTVDVRLGIFDRLNLFSAEITSENEMPLLITEIAFRAP